jgi:hypothetical protein
MLRVCAIVLANITQAFGIVCAINNQTKVACLLLMVTIAMLWVLVVKFLLQDVSRLKREIRDLTKEKI